MSTKESTEKSRADDCDQTEGLQLYRAYAETLVRIAMARPRIIRLVAADAK
jgi:hypothetical protein